MKKNKIKITFFSTWPETPDGIATFCENLAFSLPKRFRSNVITWNVIKVNRFAQIKNKYQNKVIFTVDYDHVDDYNKAANKINSSDTDVVIIQFINGIYGGEFGKYIFNFIDNLKKPLLIILHSVAMLPIQSNVSEKQKILKEFAKRSEKVVVMSQVSKKFLIAKLNFDAKNVFQIYHGAPKFKKIDKKQKILIRKKLGFSKNDFVIYTYGILREDKGIEDIINAIKILSENNENVKLLITGSDQEKNKYVNKINNLIKNLNLTKNIKFIPKFISTEDIGKYLQISDLFISAQKNLGLHSSGTLSYALSAGTVIISTPIFHAKELLGEEGVIISTNDSASMAKAILRLINNKYLYKRCKKHNVSIGKRIIWENIAKEYAKISVIIANDDKNENFIPNMK